MHEAGAGELTDRLTLAPLERILQFETPVLTALFDAISEARKFEQVQIELHGVLNPAEERERLTHLLACCETNAELKLVREQLAQLDGGGADAARVRAIQTLKTCARPVTAAVLAVFQATEQALTGYLSEAEQIEKSWFESFGCNREETCVSRRYRTALEACRTHIAALHPPAPDHPPVHGHVANHIPRLGWFGVNKIIPKSKQHRDFRVRQWLGCRSGHSWRLSRCSTLHDVC